MRLYSRLLVIGHSHEARRLRVVLHSLRTRRAPVVICLRHPLVIMRRSPASILLLPHCFGTTVCSICLLSFSHASPTESNTPDVFAESSRSSASSAAYGPEDRAIYPGRWPRRLLMLLRLIWSTAVVKYYCAVWGYSAFLIVLMLVGFRTPESSSGWNYFHDFPAELIIWAFGPLHFV